MIPAYGASLKFQDSEAKSLEARDGFFDLKISAGNLMLSPRFLELCVTGFLGIFSQIDILMKYDEIKNLLLQNLYLYIKNRL